MDRFLDISQLSIQFPKSPVPVLRQVDLRIARGEYVAVIGHSGCGKSTLLNVIAGLLPATAGGVVLEGREIDGPGPDRAVVFQNHSLCMPTGRAGAFSGAAMIVSMQAPAGYVQPWPGLGTPR